MLAQVAFVSVILIRTKREEIRRGAYFFTCSTVRVVKLHPIVNTQHTFVDLLL